MSDAAALLALQEIDTRLDQLRHRRATLPDVAELEVVDAEIADIEQAEAADRDELGRLESEQRRLEDEVSGIVDKIAREQQRQSTIIVPREAEAVQAELASLARRQDELEEHILELMEEAEPLSDASAGRQEALAGLRGRRDELAGRLAAQQADLDTEIGGVVGERDGIVGGVADQLVGRYDILRERMGGVVVGPMEGSTHTACALQLPPVEVERLAEQPVGSVQPCDECGRLIALV
ncbi:MAG: hypothetical protein AAGA99_10895 [Actinomycetota bacterium]